MHDYACLYVVVYVCVCEKVCTCNICSIYIYTHIHIHTRTHTHTLNTTRMYTYLYTYIYIYMYIFMKRRNGVTSGGVSLRYARPVSEDAHTCPDCMWPRISLDQQRPHVSRLEPASCYECNQHANVEKAHRTIRDTMGLNKRTVFVERKGTTANCRMLPGDPRPHPLKLELGVTPGLPFIVSFPL